MRLRHIFSLHIFSLLVMVTTLLSACSTKPAVFRSEKIRTDVKAGHLYALPKGYVRMTIERKKNMVNDAFALVVTPAEPLLIADPKYTFRLQYDVDPLSSEKVKIETDSMGLLKKIDVTSTDPLPAAVHDLAKFIVSASTGVFTPAQLSVQSMQSQDENSEAPKLFKVDAVFDPSKDKLKDLTDHLGKYGVTLTAERVGSKVNGNGYNVDCTKFVCYRFLLPWKISVTDNVAHMKTDVVVLLPNEAPIAGIDVQRLSLVENKTILEFNKGILTSSIYDNPSTVTSVLQLPINMLKAIVSIPAALFQFTLKSQTDTAELKANADLIKLQTDLLKAKLELMGKQRELDAAQ